MTESMNTLRALVQHIFNHPDGLIRPLTYAELAAQIGRLNRHGEPHAHGMGQTLGEMGHALRGLETKWGEEIPHIQSLVVNKTGRLKGLPDIGIKEFWPEYPSLSRLEKSLKARAEQERVLQYGSRWNDVLRQVGAEPVSPSELISLGQRRHFTGGGESPAHKRLKRYVHDNPTRFGAEGKGWEAIEEYVLPSLDSIDVLLKSATKWIAIEVKSRVSDNYPGDYERGVFQAVKYRAILQAMVESSVYAVPQEIESVLVLESTLPKALALLARKLGITTYEGIQSEISQVSKDFTSSPPA